MFKHHNIKNLITILIILILFFSCKQNLSDSEIRISLNNWELIFPADSNYYPAKVPGNIHTDLLNNNLIEHPFFADNEQNLQWIGENRWVYKCNFKVAPDDDFNYELIFNGIDTYAKIILNNEELGICSNMYRTWTFNVSDKLVNGTNKLEVVFYPVSEINRIDSINYGVIIPDKRAFSRKAPYHFGWDWGPKFETCGLWRSVELLKWKEFRIISSYVTTENITDNTANLNCQVIIESEKETNIEIFISDETNSFKSIAKSIKLNKGVNEINIPILIQNPQLWWCNGMGKANTYNLKITAKGNKTRSEKNIKLGVRTVELIKTNDSIGESFYFVLNKKPVYALGANWVPAESFPGTLSEKKYRELLLQAKEAGFNMIRVWGGGLYENDEFYHLCDSLGIMVWQDFMFACNMYPGNKDFLENVKHEIHDNVIRLRQHPSIVLWCGNNEVWNGWNDWGWQQKFNYSYEDSLKLVNAYNSIFKEIIPQEIAKLDNTRDYHESSPTYGWGHDECVTHGNSHYWGVWWGMEPFSVYYEKTGRFMSEYGFQGFPPMASFHEFLDSSDIQLQNEKLKNHQKHPTGFETIEEYMNRHFPKPANFEEYIYFSQLLQAKAVQTALDAHLSAKPHCMGTLLWQFNDCWPVISWSVVDYYGYKKAAYYTVKNMFQPIVIATKPYLDSLEFYLVNNSTTSKQVSCSFSIMDFEGNIINTDTIKTSSNTEKSIKIHTIKFKDIQHPLNEVFINIKTDSGFERNVFLVPEKDLNLPKPNLEYWKEQSADSTYIFLTSPKFVSSVYLEPTNRQNWNNNFFDIMPGDTIVIGKPIDKIETETADLIRVLFL
jgi:beta-mannosidase